MIHRQIEQVKEKEEKETITTWDRLRNPELRHALLLLGAAVLLAIVGGWMTTPGLFGFKVMFYFSAFLLEIAAALTAISFHIKADEKEKAKQKSH